ncbi:hypothetical protein PMAYCL1PPCAC_22389, partial [Pristionchus mayeri]
KGPSDRMTAHAKRVIREYTEAGNDCKDGEQIFKALAGKEPIKATSTTHCRVDSMFTEATSIKDISKLFYVEFTAEGLTAYKHYAVGEGQTVKKASLHPLNCKLGVISEGGAPGFWGSLDNSAEGKKDTGAVNTVISKSFDKKVLHCTTPGCTKSFMTERRLEEHEVIGKHVFVEHKGTLLDHAIQQFGTAVETQDAARIAVAQDSFSGEYIDGANTPLEGWALKVTTRSTISKASR